MEKIITKEMVIRGYNQHLINLILSPNGDGIVCQIGDNWFYFGGSTAEEYDNVAEYKEIMLTSDIITGIYNVLCEFKTEFEDEYLYYYYYLMENLKTEAGNKTVLYGETHSEITNILAEKVRNTSGEEQEKAKRIYLNWIEFVTELKPEGAFGLVAR